MTLEETQAALQQAVTLFERALPFINYEGMSSETYEDVTDAIVQFVAIHKPRS